LAGFAVGAVHQNCIMLQSVKVENILLRLQSSRVHSNGFSLVRKLLEKEGIFFNHAFSWHSSSTSIFDALLTPTKIYLKSCLPLLKKSLVKGMANITSGGFLEKLPRS
jgi:phosphoribosylamine--glycine ligase / phosphoribosylformylglycinamidine cyclo-ligase